MPRIPTTFPATGGAQTTIPGVAIERTGNRTTDDAQTKARAGTAPARSLPFGDGNLFPGIAMTSGTNSVITHRLGRAAKGAFPVCIRGNTPVRWTVISLGDATSGQVTVAVDSTTTVDWWVF